MKNKIIKLFRKLIHKHSWKYESKTKRVCHHCGEVQIKMYFWDSDYEYLEGVGVVGEDGYEEKWVKVI